MATLEELWTNLTYYKINTNYNDSTYQFMNTKYSEAWNNISLTRPKTAEGYGIVDGFHIVDKSSILQYGNISCHAPGKEAYVDSALACFLFQLPFFLEKIQFGYICFLLIIPILIISIFGGITESYKWYILNQAFWDLLTCYDFICENPTLIGWFSLNFYQKNTCFYFTYSTKFYGIFNGIGGGIRDSIHYAPVIPIFLLAFSRFLGIYFPFFYKKYLSKPAINIIFIAVFNFLFLFLISFRRIILVVTETARNENQENCKQIYCLQNQSFTSCYQNNPEFFQCFNQASIFYNFLISIAKNLPNYIAPGLFFLANFFAILLLFKICFQLKFQLKHNRASFISTVKIVLVIAFQSLTMSAIFVMTFIQMYFLIQAIPNPDASVPNLFLYDYKSLPGWLFFLQYYTTIASFNVIRVFLDSFIVLTVLSGYSSKVFKVFKFCFVKLCFVVNRKTLNSNKNVSTIVSISSPQINLFHLKSSEDTKKVNHS